MLFSIPETDPSGGLGGGGGGSPNDVLKWIREQPVLASGPHFAGPQAIG